MTANAKKYFRPTLETLENREMMDAGIGGAVMHPMMPDIAQGAQIRLLTQEPSALQNPNNPLSQSLTQANQAFVAQSQQVNANVQAAADHLFSAWSHHVDQVVHNIPGLQGVANRTPACTFGGLSQGDQQNQLEHDRATVSGLQSIADEYGRKVADAFIEKFAQRGYNNFWTIYRANFLSAKPLDPMTYPTRWQVDIDLERFRSGDRADVWHSTLSLEFTLRMPRPEIGPYEFFMVEGSEVTTNGKPDASLFLLQGLLIGWKVENKP